MADKTRIEWTGATWNPVTGCSVISPGCINCYAMRLAGGRMKHHPSRQGLTHDSKAGPVWTGKTRFNRDWLQQPLRWARARMIFTVAHGDLFHADVAPHEIDQVFAVMALGWQHTYQVLTKRSARMRNYMTDPATPDRVWRQVLKLLTDDRRNRENFADWMGRNHALLKDHQEGLEAFGAGREPERAPAAEVLPWPLPNVWMGVSAENQEHAHIRVWDLANTPSAVRWVSAEPLLGPISGIAAGMLDTAADGKPAVDWVVVGGESGPGFRMMNLDWAYELVTQLQDHGVRVFIKQDSGSRSGQQGRLPDWLWALKQFPAGARLAA